MNEGAIVPQLSSALLSRVPDPLPRIALRDGTKMGGCYQKMVAGIQLRWIVHTRAL